MRATQTLLLTILLATGPQAYSQKLPGTQQRSVYAPADIKIDGKATEWNNKFEAYNKTTQLYYTISNDNTALYLTIYTTDMFTVEKVLAGAIAFSVKGKDSKADPVVITYPSVGRAANSEIVMKIKEIGDNKYDKDVVNNQFNAAAKEISLKRSTAVFDTLVSIYNESGIKVAGSFDEKKAFTYELKVPFTVLSLNTNMDAIAYEVRLSGAKAPTAVGNRKIVAGINVGGGRTLPAPSEAALLEMYSPTYFSGTYIMARK